MRVKENLGSLGLLQPSYSEDNGRDGHNLQNIPPFLTVITIRSMFLHNFLQHCIHGEPVQTYTINLHFVFRRKFERFLRTNAKHTSTENAFNDKSLYLFNCCMNLDDFKTKNSIKRQTINKCSSWLFSF